MSLLRRVQPPRLITSYVIKKKGISTMEFTKYGITETPNLIYNNPLASKSDIEGFVLEGTANISFPEGKLRMENGLSAAQGQKANYVLWCPKDFPSNVYIEWEFQPLKEPGLAILFFAAKGRNGEDLFDESLQPRTGVSALSSRRYKCFPCVLFQKKRAR